jgi:hypothetical protein
MQFDGQEAGIDSAPAFALVASSSQCRQGGVGRPAFMGATTDQLVDRHTELFAEPVPERQIDARQAHGDHSAVAIS